MAKKIEVATPEEIAWLEQRVAVTEGFEQQVLQKALQAMKRRGKPRTELSESVLWETDPALFEVLNKEFQFTVDGAADSENHLLPRWWGPGGEFEDTLALLSFANERVYQNPPYGGRQRAFVEHAKQMHAEAVARGGKMVIVQLIPHTPDVAWWQDAVVYATEIRILRGRLTFYLRGKKYTTARFANAVIIWDSQDVPGRFARHVYWDWKSGTLTRVA